MSVKIVDTLGTNELKIDASHSAARNSIRPDEALTWISVGATSGLLTAAAAAAPVFSLRNIGTNLLVIRRVSVGFITTTAFTSAQGLAFNLFVARSFTASDTGGTAIAVTANQNKMRTSLATPTNLDMRIATTGAVTAGTRVLDTVAIGVAGGAATGVGAAMSPQNLLQHDAGDYPLVLAQNEGIVITNNLAMGAAGVINLHVNIEFAEMASY